MIRYNMISLLLIVVVVSLLFGGGCGAARKQTPHMGFGSFDIRTELTREDIVVLDRVEGTSSTTAIVGGLIQIIDGDKLKILGIPFFKEKYTYWRQSIYGDAGTESWERVVADALDPTLSTADRAYYNALEAAPEADAVLFKSLDHEDEGIPLIWWTKTITYKGKATKLVADE